MVAKKGLTQFEKDKATIDPDFDFEKIGEMPFDDLTTNQIGMFKWTGIYHQLQKGYFMMRIRLSGGFVTSHQLREIGKIAKQYGQNELCITTRQTFQFHWLRKEDLSPVLEALKTIEVSSKNCCGDVVRNVTTCPLQGVCQHEVFDVRDTIVQIASDKELLDKQRNLSRKHKIVVSGCNRACGLQLINCQALVPIKRKNQQGEEEEGWEYYAGGGLGQNPYMSKRIYSWVPKDMSQAVTRAAVEAHRLYGNRESRKLGRLKIVVDRFGPKGFGLLLFNLMEERDIKGIENIELADENSPNILPHPFEGQSVVPQRQPQLNVVRVMIRRSEISGDEAQIFSQWAEEFGNGEITLTTRQNLLIRNVPDDKVEPLVRLIRKAGYRLDGAEHLPDIVACVGTTYCNLAVSDTPNGYHRIMEAFADNDEYWAKLGPLQINMNGCPNSCGQHWVADIGLRGTREMQTVGSEEGFTLYLGGDSEGSGFIGQELFDVTSPEIVPTIKNLLDYYLANRNSGAERFNKFVQRVGVETLRQEINIESEKDLVQPRMWLNQQLTPYFDQLMQEVKDE